MEEPSLRHIDWTTEVLKKLETCYARPKTPDEAGNAEMNKATVIAALGPVWNAQSVEVQEDVLKELERCTMSEPVILGHHPHSLAHSLAHARVRITHRQAARYNTTPEDWSQGRAFK
ncbi:hypothetical protein JCM1840_004352 [Sporobolomyces johnsonii]